MEGHVDPREVTRTITLIGGHSRRGSVQIYVGGVREDAPDPLKVLRLGDVARDERVEHVPRVHVYGEQRLQRLVLVRRQGRRDQLRQPVQHRHQLVALHLQLLPRAPALQAALHVPAEQHLGLGRERERVDTRVHGTARKRLRANDHTRTRKRARSHGHARANDYTRTITRVHGAARTHRHGHARVQEKEKENQRVKENSLGVHGHERTRAHSGRHSRTRVGDGETHHSEDSLARVKENPLREVAAGDVAQSFPQVPVEGGRNTGTLVTTITTTTMVMVKVMMILMTVRIMMSIMVIMVVVV